MYKLPNACHKGERAKSLIYQGLSGQIFDQICFNMQQRETLNTFQMPDWTAFQLILGLQPNIYIKFVGPPSGNASPFTLQ